MEKNYLQWRKITPWILTPVEINSRDSETGPKSLQVSPYKGGQLSGQALVERNIFELTLVWTGPKSLWKNVSFQWLSLNYLSKSYCFHVYFCFWANLKISNFFNQKYKKWVERDVVCVIGQMLISRRILFSKFPHNFSHIWLV